jgi:ABC-type phosphate transport system permease subunit
VLYQPLTVPGWIALIAVTFIVGVAIALILALPYGILAGGVAFYLASAVIRAWEHRQIRRTMADSERGRGRPPRE